MQLVSQTPFQYLHFVGSVSIHKVCWTDKVFHFISEDGTVYSSGNDSMRNGILGLDNIYLQSDPVINPYLKDYKIKSLSIWDSHACAVDASGKLYTWGTGRNGELGQNKKTFNPVPTLLNI